MGFVTDVAVGWAEGNLNAPRKMDAVWTGYSIRAVGWCCLTDAGYEWSGENGCRLHEVAGFRTVALHKVAGLRAMVLHKVAGLRAIVLHKVAVHSYTSVR